MLSGHAHLAKVREGPAGGGTKVWLHGRGFTADTVVQFGGVAASSICVAAPDLIKCVSPACAAPGKVPIVACSASSGAVADGALWFSYAAPGPSHPELHHGLHHQGSFGRRFLASIERAQTSSKAAARGGRGALLALRHGRRVRGA